jgi:hypothetical protein
MKYKGWSKDVNETIIALLGLIIIGIVLIKLR